MGKQSYGEVDVHKEEGTRNKIANNSNRGKKKGK